MAMKGASLGSRVSFLETARNEMKKQRSDLQLRGRAVQPREAARAKKLQICASAHIFQPDLCRSIGSEIELRGARLAFKLEDKRGPNWSD